MIPAGSAIAHGITGAAVSGFSDVEQGKFYSEPIAWAKTNGITTGRTPSSFAPGEPVTRGEVVTFLHRFYTTYIVGPSPTPTGGIVPGDGIWLVGNEILPGTYRTVVPVGSNNCYLARLSGLGGSFRNIISNDNWSAGATVTIAISAGDMAFQTEGCGTWHRI